MQPSPIKLRELYYLGISIWPNDQDENSSQQPASTFDFDGVMISEAIKIAPFPDPDDQDSFGVVLRIAIDNKEGKSAPYTIDVEVAGRFAVANNTINKEKHQELVIVNGCAILYSAIREQVMAITSRFLAGTLILPTVNFLDKIKKPQETGTAQQKLVASRKKKPAKTKE